VAVFEQMRPDLEKVSSASSPPGEDCVHKGDETILIPREHADEIVRQMRTRYANEAREKTSKPKKAGWIASVIVARMWGLPRDHEIDLERAERNLAQAEEELKRSPMDPFWIRSVNSARRQLERVLQRINQTAPTPKK